MINKRRVLLLLIACVSIIFLAACGNTDDKENNGAVSDDETVTLKMASYISMTDPWTIEVEQEFIKKVEELSNGKVIIEHYPGGQLGGGAELFDFTADGTVDIGFVVPAYEPTKMALTENVASMPGLFTNSYEGTYAYQKISQESPILEEDYLKHGIRPLYFAAGEPYDLYSAVDGKEIRVPSDIKGMQIRAAGGVKSELLDYLGASVVTIPASDLYSALDRGVVEGVHINHKDIESYGITEKIKSATNGLAISATIFGLAINEDKYQSLSDEAKDALMTAAEEIHEVFPTSWQEFNLTATSALEENGVALHEPTDEERAEWEFLFEEFREKHMKKLDDDNFNKVYNRFNELLEEAR